MDKGGTREVKTVLEKLELANGIEFHKGALYVATPKMITRCDDIENKLDKRPCASCHNPDFFGREQMPRLAHQREEYLLRAMRESKSGARIGYAGAMAEELQGLSDDDLQDLAHFFAHLPRP